MASAPTYTALLVRYPKLTAPADSDEQTLLNTMLSEAWDEADEDQWEDLRTKATMLAAAHEWQMFTRAKAGKRSAEAGPVKSKSAGGWSKTYGDVKTAGGARERWLAQSEYGLMLLSLEARHQGNEWFDGPDF